MDRAVILSSSREFGKETGNIIIVLQAVVNLL